MNIISKAVAAAAAMCLYAATGVEAQIRLNFGEESPIRKMHRNNAGIGISLERIIR